ncbi:MAG: ribosomal protein S19 family protein, partial [Spirochaetales bacterium]|nr:ribosomal protein S19 family protein [Spirochaetales bacterium]
MARSIKKGPFVEPRLLKRVQDSNNAGQKDMIKTYSRASVIIPDMVGFT